MANNMYDEIIRQINNGPAEKPKVDADKVWEEYTRGRSYNESIELVENVQKCEDFFVGDQWKGCETPDLDKPVFNIMRRVISYFITNIMSDDIGIHMESFTSEDDVLQLPDGGTTTHDDVLTMLDGQLDSIMEFSNVRGVYRDMLRNSAIDGDGCVHYYFDPDDTRGNTGAMTGNIKAEILENYRVYFGNPQDKTVENQPYIILEFRKTLAQVQKQAKANGIAEWDQIQPDRGEKGVNADEEHGKVTVLRKYWRDDDTNTIWYVELCRGCLLTEPTDMQLTRYPLVWMPWEPVKNSYHGRSAIRDLIPNQIFINKLYAMIMRHVQSMAFPKIAYNRSMLPGGWSNRVGEAIPVNGDPGNAIAHPIAGIDMSGQVMAVIQQVINDTRDTMGASDAALGNIKPDNTSAIIATQKATAMPLERQKWAFYDAVEESVRIWIDMMSVYYGQRVAKVKVTPAPIMTEMGVQEQEPVDQNVLFDFSALKGLDLKTNVDIGAATYWSELMQVQTLDNLYTTGILQDPEIYLNAMPKGYVKNRDEIVESIQAQREQQQQLEALAAMTGGVPNGQMP